jgi:hypothetical protein
MTRAEEIVERIRGIDYWEGNGNDLIDWVEKGYVDHGDRIERNPRWIPLESDKE